ncbi:MAG: DNA repair protein RecN [Blautia sp.]|jgi:DNA repair protein RecN (Recombination protein N)
MLLNLHVKNMALIDEIEVDFSKGLNILTGETGAGKSILLGSMQLVLGAKVSKDMIRSGADYALVELLFSVDHPKTRELLEEMDLELEDGCLLLSRKITESRSIGRINGQTCTVAQMKQVASLLLDIHGQHEHQSLLYPKKQLEIVDAYAGPEGSQAKERVQKAYEEYRDCKTALESMHMDEEGRNREKAFLKFEIGEIEEAALVPGEDETLERDYRRMNNSKKILESLSKAHAATGYDSYGGAGEQVGAALQELSSVLEYDESLLELSSMLTDIDSLLGDFNRELASYMADAVFEEEAFYETEKRLDLLNGLKSKYGATLEQVLEYQAGQQKKLEELEAYEQTYEALTQKLKEKEAVLEKASHELSKVRKEYGKELEKAIILGLKDLNFLDVDFEIAFAKSPHYSAGGYDQVEYRISTNPGETKKPFGKVVSGGELSRIMLAVKALLADKDDIETLIFDEIDTGISGRTAQKVSEKMEYIGRSRQVLCITHLPQIASMADAHYEITKMVEDGQTVSRIRRLDEEASIIELARMLGGAKVTQTVLDSAKEMKELAQVHKTARLKS